MDTPQRGRPRQRSPGCPTAATTVPVTAPPVCPIAALTVPVTAPPGVVTGANELTGASGLMATPPAERGLIPSPAATGVRVGTNGSGVPVGGGGRGLNAAGPLTSGGRTPSPCDHGHLPLDQVNSMITTPRPTS